MTGIAPTQSSPVSLATLQQTVATKISQRLTELSTLNQSLQTNTSLSATDRQQLQTEISNDVTGLQALQTKVAGETSASGVRADAHSMVVDYRVFAVEAPKVRFAERTANQEQRISNLQAKINDVQGQGTSATANLADAQTELNAAQTALQGKSDAVLALTPQDYTSGLFNQYHNATASAEAYLSATRTDLAL